MAASPESPTPTINEGMEMPEITSTKDVGRQEIVCADNPPTRSGRSSVSLRANIHFATLCWAAILNGWNDGSIGSLLPRIQQVYHVGYAVVSLIFVFTTLGYIAGCISNMFLTERIGFGKILVIGSVIQIVAYSIEAAAPPFPVFVFAYTINSYGIALQAAQNLGYVLRFEDNPALRTGLLMEAYGLGALLSPLSATYFARTPHWSYHFLTCVGIAILNAMFLTIVFRLKPQQACLAEIGITNTEKGPSKRSPLGQILGLRDVHLLAAFVLFYVGAEVTLGGWIVTYIVRHRHGTPSSGYISTGFWAGLTIGRVALIKVNNLIGESRAILVYSFLSTTLQLIVWFVPSLIGDAIAIASIGVLLGPMYPIAANHAGRVLPQWLLTSAMGWIVAGGQAGSALIPFVTGVIAQRAGIGALQPVLVAVFVIMIAVWMMVLKSPSKPSPVA